MLNITITTCRRHDILDVTLESFRKNLFKDYNKYNLFINIDPVGTSFQQEVEDVVFKYHSNPVILSPKEASFPKAVKSLWKTCYEENDYNFHMEDDWLLLEELDLTDILKYLHLGKYDWVNLRASMKGYTTPSLGNGFSKIEYIKKIVKLMTDNVSPEKQLKEFRCRNSTYPNRITVKDIGREWLKKNGYERKRDEVSGSKFVGWQKKKGEY